MHFAIAWGAPDRNVMQAWHDIGTPLAFDECSMFFISISVHNTPCKPKRTQAHTYTHERARAHTRRDRTSTDRRLAAACPCAPLPAQSQRSTHGLCPGGVASQKTAQVWATNVRRHQDRHCLQPSRVHTTWCGARAKDRMRNCKKNRVTLPAQDQVAPCASLARLLACASS